MNMKNESTERSAEAETAANPGRETGRRRIVVCMGSSCFARGNAENLEAIERYLAERGLAAEVELTGSRCEGRCSDGPVVTIDGQRHFRMEPGRVPEILAAHWESTEGTGP